MSFWWGEEADPLDDRFLDPDRWGEIEPWEWDDLEAEDWGVLFEIYADDPAAMEALEELYSEQ